MAWMARVRCTIGAGWCWRRTKPHPPSGECRGELRGPGSPPPCFPWTEWPVRSTRESARGEEISARHREQSLCLARDGRLRMACTEADYAYLREIVLKQSANLVDPSRNALFDAKLTPIAK